MTFWRRRRCDVKYLERDVVMFRGAQWPSATIPGDTLWVWRRSIRLIVEQAEAVGDQKLMDESQRLQKMINHTFDDYNDVCKRRGLGGFLDPDGEGMKSI